MDHLISTFEKSDPFETWWPTITAVIVGALIIVRTYMSGQRCPNENQIKEQIVIVTGGNSGIGFEIAKALAERGGHIIIACRDMIAAEKAIYLIKRELSYQKNLLATKRSSFFFQKSKIISETKCKEKYFVEARYLDLCSFKSVQQFARHIMTEFDRIDVLVNNAGVIFRPTTNTIDGFEEHLQINFLAPFLLTQLLLPHLKRAKHGRIINVSAHAHKVAKINYQDPLNIGSWSVKFHARDAFAHSKLAIILATRWQAHLLKDTSITTNCFTPGLVRGTCHLRNSPLMSSICIRILTFPWMWLFMKNPFEGAQCALYLATNPQLKHISGEYFIDCEIGQTSEAGKDTQLAQKLFTQTIETLEKVIKISSINKELQAK